MTDFPRVVCRATNPERCAHSRRTSCASTIIAGLALLLFQGSAFAQSGPYYAVVTDSGTKLRALPSDKFETATLPKGFPVLVDHEEDGWLAVQDVPGQMNSVSWVQTQFVNFDKNSPIPQLVEVHEAGTTLRPGQIGLAQPLPVQKAKVPGGTILTVIGKGVEFEGKTWYPVVPPAGDFRYLPKQAVTFQKSATTAFGVRRDGARRKRCPRRPGPGQRTPGTVLPAASDTQDNRVGKSTQNPLWTQAEAAEREADSTTRRNWLLSACPHDERTRWRPRYREPLLHPYPRHPREEARRRRLGRRHLGHR
ncbi:MAG: hypothetical protein U0792_11015 [Gemmataceae bacterium]